MKDFKTHFHKAEIIPSREWATHSYTGKCACGWEAMFNERDEYDPDGVFNWAREKYQVQLALDEHFIIQHLEPLLDLQNIKATYHV